MNGLYVLSSSNSNPFHFHFMSDETHILFLLDYQITYVPAIQAPPPPHPSNSLLCRFTFWDLYPYGYGSIDKCTHMVPIWVCHLKQISSLMFIPIDNQPLTIPGKVRFRSYTYSSWYGLTLYFLEDKEKDLNRHLLRGWGKGGNDI